jgi:hypothetical protein
MMRKVVFLAGAVVLFALPAFSQNLPQAQTPIPNVAGCHPGMGGELTLTFCITQNGSSLQGTIAANWDNSSLGTKPAARGSPWSFTSQLRSDGTFDIWADRNHHTYRNLRLENGRIKGMYYYHSMEDRVPII